MDWNDKDQVLKTVRENGSAFWDASEALRNDKDVVLTAVRDMGLALEHASEALKTNGCLC